MERLLSLLLLFAAAWCCLLILFAFVGGWTRLADRYRAHHDHGGTLFRRQSGAVGAVRYPAVLDIRVSDAGLHLSVASALRLAHPPLFIPWDAVNNPRMRRELLWDFVTFDVGYPTIATVKLPGRVLDARNANP